ncbi:MAG: carboxypeptidase regulatory-like domain-containing protein [Bryobacteraceae bacterium]
MNNRTIRVSLVGILSAWSIFCQAPAAPQVSPSQTPARRAARTGNGTITGTVKDDTGGVIPGATITVATEKGVVQTVQSGGDGSYTFRGLPPASYTVSATYSGLQQEGATAITLGPGQGATGDITMTLQVQKQEVTVTDTAANTVSTDPANNAGALVLREEDLDALPDDPDDLEADLQALAGPSAGPGGNQIFIDGFTGGRLPPKESIREIRINSNPFSAEFDKLGFGRIQIFTKPGSDKFHGQAMYSISDNVWNSRNPFSTVDPPFRSQQYGGNVSGPLGKHASFFVDVERRAIDDNGIIVATIPTPDYLGVQPFGNGNPETPNYFATPQRRTTASPRVDYQLNSNNTLSFRYSYLKNDRPITGIGNFNLPSTAIGNFNFPGAGYGTNSEEHSIQAVETAVLSAKAVNETHFQYDRSNQTWTSQSQAPQLNVAQSFTVGGSGYAAPGYSGSYDRENAYELQNYTSLTEGAHTIKFGIRIRASDLENSSPRNFNGIYSFLGGNFRTLDPNTLAPAASGVMSTLTSIQQYNFTERLLATGLSSQAVAALGYGPSKYTVSAGNPYVSFYQMDFGPFVQDDWKLRPNLTLSLGLRWESQTNIYDHSSVAPRFAFAWSPDAKAGGGRAKTVIRGGWGVFYDRFSAANVMTAYRYLSGDPLKTYTINKPTTFNAGFDTQITSGLTSTSSQIYQIDKSLQAPMLMQTAIGVERQLFGRTTLSFNFTNARGVHELRTVDINAPYATPGLLPPSLLTPTALIRPYGNNVGDIYNYESGGIYKQTQVMVNLNTSIGRWATIFSRYAYSNAHSDTDGLSTMPSNPYDFKADWGRTGLNVSHNLFVGGSVTTKYGIRLSPFLVAHSGTPFNITTGTDLYLQGNVTPTARPELVDNALTGSRPSPLGILYPYPTVGTPVIERYAGTGAGFIGLNLRVSKTWGFGPTKFKGTSGGARAGGGGGRGPGGGGGGRGGRGGGGFGGFGGGPPGGMGGESTEHRYNLTFSLNARNILNHENLNTFNGAMTSQYFYQPTGITGGFGGEATASNQRRIDMQLRFSF